uniref:Coatomer subunit delta n=1 Tax=Heterosigma akashiwo TaxID=2829 RepID=A0A6V1QEA3_HETAK
MCHYPSKHQTKFVSAPPTDRGDGGARHAQVDESGKFTYQPHPKVDRAAFDGGRALAMKDPAKGFPLERALGLLRWSAAGAMGGGAGLKVPLSINCWPEEEGRGAMAVSIEYSLERPDMRLHDVVVTVPLGTAEQPTIQDVDGNVRHDAREGTLSWLVDLIDSSNRTGSLEFTVPCRDPDAFFPITVAFTSSDLYCNCEVLQITTVEGDTPVQFGLTKQLATDEYQVA